MTLRALWPVTQQFQAKNGSNLVSGKVYIYYQGRTALATTYHDEDGTVVNSNPVLLDNNGRATVFADTAYSYTIVVCDYYGKELFSQDITLHDVTETADEITLIGSDGSIHIDTSSSKGVKTFDMSANTNILATKKSVDDLDVRVKKNEDNIKVISGNVENIVSEMSGKKDKQSELTFNGSATKTVKKITQNVNGEMNVEFEDINLPQEVPNVEITSEDKSIKVSETTDVQTNTKKFDLSVQDGGTTYSAGDAIDLTNDTISVKYGKGIEITTDNKLQLKVGKGLSLDNDTLEVTIKDLATSITDFRTGDVILVDGPDGTAKMSKDDLLKETAENALSWSVANAFKPTSSYKQNELVVYNGRLYKFKYNKPAGVWDASAVEGVRISEYLAKLNQLKDIGYTIRTGGYWGTDGTYHTDTTKNYKNTLLIDCAEGDVFTYQGKGTATIASVLFFNGNVFVSSEYYDASEEPIDVTVPNGVNVVRFGSFANAPSDAELMVAKLRTEDAELLGLIRKNAKEIDYLENHKITKEDVASSFTEDESKFVIDTDFTSVTPHYTNYVALRFNTSGAGAKTIRIKGKFSIAGGLDAGAYYVKLFDGSLNRLETLILPNTSGSNDVDFTYQQYTFPTAQVYIGIQVGDIPVESVVENLELYDGATLVPFSGVYQFSEYCAGTFSSEQVTRYGFATNDKLQAAKKEYTPDLIHFQVEVNQNFADVEDDTAVLKDSESFAPVNCVLKLPSNYTPSGKPTKLIMFAHGAGSLITGNEISYWNPIVQPLWDNGYAVFDVNGSNNNYTTYADNMGSPRTISAYRKALQYIVENYNVEDKIYLMGVSMGGLVALNFVQQYPELVNVIGLMNPITAMYKAAWLHPWYGVDADWPNGRTHTMIAHEFDFDDQSGATYEADKVQGYDPLLNHSVVVGANRHNFLPCSIKIWHGENDTTALEENILELVTALKNAGINAVLRNMAGVGHNTTQVMYEEIAMWFNRF